MDERAMNDIEFDDDHDLALSLFRSGCPIAFDSLQSQVDMTDERLVFVRAEDHESDIDKVPEKDGMMFVGTEDHESSIDKVSKEGGIFEGQRMLKSEV